MQSPVAYVSLLLPKRKSKHQQNQRLATATVSLKTKFIPAAAAPRRICCVFTRVRNGRQLEETGRATRPRGGGVRGAQGEAAHRSPACNVENLRPDRAGAHSGRVPCKGRRSAAANAGGTAPLGADGPSRLRSQPSPEHPRGTRNAGRRHVRYNPKRKRPHARTDMRPLKQTLACPGNCLTCGSPSCGRDPFPWQAPSGAPNRPAPPWDSRGQGPTSRDILPATCRNASADGASAI